MTTYFDSENLQPETYRITVLHAWDMAGNPKAKTAVVIVDFHGDKDLPDATSGRIFLEDGHDYAFHSFQMLREDVGTNRRAFITRGSASRFSAQMEGYLRLNS